MVVRDGVSSDRRASDFLQGQRMLQVFYGHSPSPWGPPPRNTGNRATTAHGHIRHKGKHQALTPPFVPLLPYYAAEEGVVTREKNSRQGDPLAESWQSYSRAKLNVIEET